MPIAHFTDEEESKYPSVATSSNPPSLPLARSGQCEPFHAADNSQPLQPTITQAHLSGRISPTETRQELIERIKRNQRSAWLQGGNGSNVIPTEVDIGRHIPQATPPPLLPPAELIAPQNKPNAAEDQDHASNAASIQRPRSALHRGDFRQEVAEPQPQDSKPKHGSPFPQSNPPTPGWLSTSPTSPWYTPRHVPTPRFIKNDTFNGFGNERQKLEIPSRTRAASYSASSFVFRPPTSPLANETNNSDSEGREFSPRGRSRSPDKASRRRTFSPRGLQTMRPTPWSHGSSPIGGRALPNLRREGSFPYQAHQPRRSVNLDTDPAFASLPQTPSARSRRPSLVSEASPLQRLPMVGRYEESILRGRMSSLPSRPLDFVAQIGVLGKGKCKASLRCPPHVTVPFPAVFYNYGSRPGSPVLDDGPSPYVGMVDLDTLPISPSHAAKEQTPGPAPTMGHFDDNTMLVDEIEQQNTSHRTHTGSRHKGARQMPNGGYRIPQEGQLQIIIKNPNKTAVKLYLVPYDLSGMQPGQKTFIRQRSYSAGPIIDMPISARTNLGTDRPEAAISNSDNPKDRPMLRYLIHLNICCPSKGRFYLYKSIRVVFANRVPDGKEKLRQEIQLPEPRFSIWKPDKERSGSGADFPAKGPYRNRFSFDGDYRSTVLAGSPTPVADLAPAPLIGHQPFTFPFQEREVTHNSHRPPTRDREDTEMASPPSPLSSRSNTLQFMESPSPAPQGQHVFERLTRDEYGNGSALRQRTQSPAPGEGLLALQIRDLADRAFKDREPQT